MGSISLDKDIILDAAEEAIRRFGPHKANICDAAKALKVSHAAIYRYFENKTALWNAVTERWLNRIFAPLEPILHEDLPVEKKLQRWLTLLVQGKRKSAFDDPEMFANYTAMAADASEVLERHMEQLVSQLESIIIQGATEGIFSVAEPHQAAKAIFLATSRFHHPAFVNEWYNDDIEQKFQTVVALLINGIKTRC